LSYQPSPRIPADDVAEFGLQELEGREEMFAFEIDEIFAGEHMDIVVAGIVGNGEAVIHVAQKSD